MFLRPTITKNKSPSSFLYLSLSLSLFPHLPCSLCGGYIEPAAQTVVSLELDRGQGERVLPLNFQNTDSLSLSPSSAGEGPLCEPVFRSGDDTASAISLEAPYTCALRLSRCITTPQQSCSSDAVLARPPPPPPPLLPIAFLDSRSSLSLSLSYSVHHSHTFRSAVRTNSQTLLVATTDALIKSSPPPPPPPPSHPSRLPSNCSTRALDSRFPPIFITFCHVDFLPTTAQAAHDF